MGSRVFHVSGSDERPADRAPSVASEGTFSNGSRRGRVYSDITPSLYALLGYEPEDLGPLFGRRLFAPRDDDSSLRRPDPFLLASSYGAVYGVLRQNGRRLYVVDAVDGREYAFDLSASAENVPVTPAMTTVNRRLIEEQLRALASVYRYRP